MQPVGKNQCVTAGLNAVMVVDRRSNQGRQMDRLVCFHKQFFKKRSQSLTRGNARSSEPNCPQFWPGRVSALIDLDGELVPHQRI